MNDKNYDYGKCQVCGEQMVEKRINQEFWIKEDLIVIENVPAGVCPRCGEKIVKADVGVQISAIIAGSKNLTPVRSLSVPVLAFREAA